MSITSLDVSTLQHEQTYVCKDGTQINMVAFMDQFYEVIQTLVANGLIRANESFGFAMAIPQLGETLINIDDWDDPSKFVWFVYGWGPDKDRYIANAVRKMRASLRTGDSTLDIRYYTPDAFQDVVDSKANNGGTFPWGDFPWGGAVFVDVFEVNLLLAISCLHEIEDDTASRLIGGSLGKLIAIGNGLVEA